MANENKNAVNSRGSRLVRKLSALSAGEELRVKSLGETCNTLTDLQEIAAACEEKCVSVVFEDDNFVINGKQEMSLAGALRMVIRARKIIVSTRTKAGLDKARKAGKRLGAVAGRSWKNKKLTGREKEIQTFLDNKITLSTIARALKVDTKTLKAFMRDNGLNNVKSASLSVTARSKAPRRSRETAAYPEQQDCRENLGFSRNDSIFVDDKVGSTKKEADNA